MKRLNILLLVVISLTGHAINVNAQMTSGSATYKASLGVSLDEISSKVEEEVNDEESAQALSILSVLFGSGKGEDILLTLDFSDEESQMRPLEKMPKDDLSLNITLLMVEDIGPLYTDYGTMTTLTLDESLGERLIIRDSLERFKWVLKNEKKQVGDFLCLKAVGRRLVSREEGNRYGEVEAWYSPEIPIPTGPAGYGGLPGLILELNENRATHYSLTNLEFISKSELKIKRPKRGKLLSREEYVALMERIEGNK